MKRGTPAAIAREAKVWRSAKGERRSSPAPFTAGLDSSPPLMEVEKTATSPGSAAQAELDEKETQGWQEVKRNVDAAAEAVRGLRDEVES